MLFFAPVADKLVREKIKCGRDAGWSNTHQSVSKFARAHFLDWENATLCAENSKHVQSVREWKCSISDYLQCSQDYTISSQFWPNSTDDIELPSISNSEVGDFVVSWRIILIFLLYPVIAPPMRISLRYSLCWFCKRSLATLRISLPTKILETATAS
jgi:hypothetical protein